MDIHRTAVFVARLNAKTRHLIDVDMEDPLDRPACGKSGVRMFKVYPIGLVVQAHDQWILRHVTCQACLAAYAASKLREAVV